MFRGLLTALGIAYALHAAAAPAIRGVEATDTTLRFKLAVDNSSTPREVILQQLSPCEPLDNPSAEEVGRGEPGSLTIEIPRFAVETDRMYARFMLKDSDAAESKHWVSAFSLGEQRHFPFPRPASIKGLQVQMVDDALALGIKHAGLNVSFPLLLSGASDSPFWRDVDGERIHFSPHYVERLDRTVKPLTDAGVNVMAIFLNTKYGQQPGSPLLHPETKWDEAPTFVVAFNLTTPHAIRRYRAALEFLAERYSHPDAPHGWVTGYIIGNEVQSHWMWHNRGTVDDEVVIDEYTTALRLADIAVRSIHSSLRVYASLDHFWQERFPLPPGRAMPGRKLLDGIARRAREGGDFPWGVALHPYPENLFNPRFWHDTTAPLRHDAPRITLNNIEVLTSYLRRPELLYEGQPRRVTLSEQGFHTVENDPAGTDGEALQAAAFARAYYKLRHLEGVDSFLLHRHVDHSDEGGLRLGLWTRRADVPGSTPDQKKKIYEVFRQADTPQWAEAFDFARPLVEIETWDEALPQQVSP